MKGEKVSDLWYVIVEKSLIVHMKGTSIKICHYKSDFMINSEMIFISNERLLLLAINMS